MLEVGKHYWFLLIGPLIWAKGPTLKDAKKALTKQHRGRLPGYYEVYLADPGTTINPAGDLSWPEGGREPIKVEEVKVGRRKATSTKA